MNSQRCTGYQCAVMAGVAAVLLATCAGAQPYPTKPIRLVCPFPPGGTTDVVSRTVAQRLTLALGQQVLVDNRGGAGSLIGMEIVAKAAPNGYTILVGSSAATVHAANPHLKINFDLLNDLLPVSLVVASPQLLAVNPSVPARTLPELINVAKTTPRRLSYATPGVGTPQHLAFELFKSMAGIDAVHIPYKGTGPAILELIGGQVETMITGVVALMPHLKAGQLRGIAVTSPKRLAALPDIPTFSESGIPKFNVSSWMGVFVPGGTPQPIVAKLNGEIRKLVEIAEVRKQLMDLGADPASNTPEEFAAYVRQETATWAKIFKSTGIRTE